MSRVTAKTPGDICWTCRSRLQANGRTFEMNLFQDVEVCQECRRELNEGLGNIQHAKACSHRTEDSDDDIEGGEVCPHVGHAEDLATAE